jgi:hypothetical protein
MQKGRAKPGLFNDLDYSVLAFRSLWRVYGRKPIMRAPMNAKAAQIINALIGLVSPIAIASS